MRAFADLYRELDAATALLTYYGAAGPEVAEAGEPQRWTLRPPVALAGAGLAFGRADSEPEWRRRFARATPLATLSRRVGGADVETFSIFRVETPLASPPD